MVLTDYSRTSCVNSATPAAKVSNKEFYTVSEFAKLVDRAEYTVREWARLGRLRAEKTHGGRGRKAEWRFTQAEFNRFEAEGLFPESQIEGRVEKPDLCSEAHE